MLISEVSTEIIKIHSNHTNFIISSLLPILLIASIIFLRILTKKSSRRVSLVDFSCYKPPESQKWSREVVLDRLGKQEFSEDSVSLMAKIMQGSGIGDSAYLPQNILSVPPDLSIEAARSESEMVIFGAIDSLMAKTKIPFDEIGILIVNCSVFNVIPSLSSIIVNRYGLREDICCYNLSGMGCSASLLAVGLANQLLQLHPNTSTCALVVSTENTTSSVYTGTHPSMLPFNCLFRAGGSAVLLSNKPSLHRYSKYELLHAVRTQTASSDVAYRCLFQEEDSQGNLGFTITKHLLVAITSVLEQHLQKLGFLILPLSDQLHLAKSYIGRRLHLGATDTYIPNFKRCTDHFLSHVGGKPVQDAVGRKLGFRAADMEPSRMTLYRFGNTSSSSIWYELAYTEAKGRVKKGHRVWQIAYGSGVKCGSLILGALRDVEGDEMNPWMTEIHAYPLQLDTSVPFLSLFHPPKLH